MLIAFNTIAADNGLVINLASKHVINNGAEYNEENYGIGYTSYFEEQVAWQVGFYDNSYDNWSMYGAYKFYFRNTSTSRINPFGMLGLATGYEELPIRPIVALGLDIEPIKTHKLNIMVSPIATTTRTTSRYGNQTENHRGLLFALQYEKLF